MKSFIIFLDASVILSGLASPGGGSGLLFRASKLKKLTLITTPLVIGEVYRHLPKLKLSIAQLENLLDEHIIGLIEDPSKKTILRYKKVTTDPDDAHVLAGTVTSQANYLISLDKKHILTKQVQQGLSPIRVYSPKQFWQSLSP